MQGKSIIGMVDDGEFTYRELRGIVEYAKFQERQWGQNYHDVRQAEVYRLRCDKLSQRVADLTAERDALRAQLNEIRTAFGDGVPRPKSSRGPARQGDQEMEILALESVAKYLNWDDAPPDAQWHTTDSAGSAWWTAEPQLVGGLWCWRRDSSECQWYDGEPLPISITRRPEPNHDAT